MIHGNTFTKGYQFNRSSASFETPANIELMNLLYLTNEESLSSVLKRLKGRGFVKFSMETIKLLPPAKRFLDLAEQFNSLQEELGGEEE